MDKPRILFLGLHNTTYSLMAEALMRKKAGGAFDIYSAGIQPLPVDPEVIQVLEEAGCDTRQVYSKDFNDLVSQTSFSVIVQIRTELDPFDQGVPGLSMLLHWSVESPPITGSLPEDKICGLRILRDEIDRKLSQFILDLQHTTIKSTSN